MTPEERDLLNKVLKIAEENNKILHGIRRSARFSSFLRIIYWIIILGSAFGTYYFIQPYIDILVKNYNGMQQNVDLIKNTINLPSLPAALSGKK